MITLHTLLERKGSKWVEAHLKTKREPRNYDREGLQECMINGMSPGLAARKVWTAGSKRGYTGLVWLSNEVENQLFEILGEGIDVLLERLRNDQEVEVQSSRMRRLELAAIDAGLDVERVTILRLKCFAEDPAKE